MAKGRDNIDYYEQQYDPFADQNRVNAIKGFYTQYLGRDADQGGLNGWIGGGMDLGSVESAIKNSDEAKQWLSASSVPQPTNAPPAPAGDYATNMVNSWMANNNPQGHQDAGYWLRRISETGGLRPDNVDYWQGRFTEAPGTHIEGPTGGQSYSPQPQQQQQSDPIFAALLARMTQQDQANAAQKAADQQKADALYQQLQGRAQQSLAIDRNDPIIRAQADAFAANEQRASRNYLADLAEKAGPLANLQGEQRMAAEHLGQATGGFEAELMGRELQSRRSEIADALNSMRGMLSADQQDNLQRELASLDAAIKQQGLAVNQSQFGSDLGYRYANLAQQGSQFDRNLAQSGSQFDRNLGFNYENMDNGLLRLLLGGLG